MIKALSRKEIFHESVFVDNQVAFEQQAILRTLAADSNDERDDMKPILDHLNAFYPQSQTLQNFCVLAYDALDKADYNNNFAKLMVGLFTKLQIRELYLLTVIKNDWDEYIFENDEKKDLFLKIVSRHEDGGGLKIEVKHLPKVLPLFFHSHPDYPHINLMSAEEDLPINLLLCKDGNFHTLLNVRNEEQLRIAANATGLVMGDYEICRVIKNS